MQVLNAKEDEGMSIIFSMVLKSSMTKMPKNLKANVSFVLQGIH